MAEKIILIILCILVGVEFLIIRSISLRQRRQKNRYDNLLRGTSSDANIEQLLLDINKKLDDRENQMKTIDDKAVAASKITRGAFNRVSIVHYNASQYDRNNLSFSLCLLDSDANGLILTSIYGRDYSNTYAKEIIQGVAGEDLSPFEEECLKKAKK